MISYDKKTLDNDVKGEFNLESRTERIIWIELLRIVAIFAVIVLHVATKGWKNAELYSSQWVIYEIAHIISRFGVCCFVMISGSLFLSKDRNIGDLYKRNILKIVVIIAVWSCVYLAFRFCIADFQYNGLKSLLSNLLLGNYHLWYLWMTVGLYAVSPILRKIVSDKRCEEYFLILTVFAAFLPGMLGVVPLLDELAQLILTEKMFFFLPMGYVGYFVLGHYISTYDLGKRKKIYLLGIIGILYGVVGGILYSRHIGEPSQAAYNNLTLNIALYSGAIFLTFKDNLGRIRFSKQVEKIIRYVGSCTLGIYLTHVLFVQGITDKIFVATGYRYPVLILPLAVLVFVLAFVLTALLRSIPLVKKWLV